MNTSESSVVSVDTSSQQQPPMATATVTMGTLMGPNPRALLVSATELAKPLAEVIRSQKLSVAIRGKEFVRVEGWTTLAVMCGCTPREVSTEATPDGVYIATIELVNINTGVIIGRASAECGGPTDQMWAARPAFARRSMAQTRATGKACRLAFSWIMVLAGYEPGTAEEQPEFGQPQQQPQRTYQRPQQQPRPEVVNPNVKDEKPAAKELVVASPAGDPMTDEQWDFLCKLCQEAGIERSSLATTLKVTEDGLRYLPRARFKEIRPAIKAAGGVLSS